MACKSKGKGSMILQEKWIVSLYFCNTLLSFTTLILQTFLRNLVTQTWWWWCYAELEACPEIWDQISNAFFKIVYRSDFLCLLDSSLCFQDDATFLLHTFSDFFDQKRKMKRNWAYNLTHLTIFSMKCT